MIRIAICDDDIPSLERVYGLLTDHLRSTWRDDFLVRRFHSLYDLMECLENPNLYFNIYYLEIEMPVYSGIEAGRIIRQNDEFASIIYMTVSPSFALDAAATAPLQYLMKPVAPRQLLETVDSACRRLRQAQGKNLLIKRKDGITNVAMHQIEYIEYQDHALAFHLQDGRVVDSRTLHESFSEIAERSLADSRFLRPHQSFVINMDHVSSVSAKEFAMDSGAMIPISKRLSKEVRERFMDYATRENGSMVI